MITFEAFYSHSFEEKDIEINEKFKKIFEAFDFKIYEHKIREGEQLGKEIIKHISNKDIFIGVITKNSSWLNSELTLAYHLKQNKLFVLCEEGIQIDGILNESEIRKVSFKRDNLLCSLIDQNVLGAIYKFKEDLIGEIYFPFYRYDKIYSVRKIINQNEYEVRERRTVVSLNDFLYEIPYTSRNISGNNIDVSVNEENFTFTVLEKPFDKNIYYKIKSNYKHEFKFVTFVSPSLKKGEKIIYEFKYKRKNLKKCFKEDVPIQENKQYPIYSNTYLQRANTVITQPTKKLILEIEFPENYKIGAWGSYVFLNKTSNRNQDEEKRVNVELIDRIGAQVLRLEVDYPKINHNYHLFYEPPSKMEIDASVCREK